MRLALHLPAMMSLKHNPLMNVTAKRLEGDGRTLKSVSYACMHKFVHLACGVLKSRTVIDGYLLANQPAFQFGV